MSLQCDHGSGAAKRRRDRGLRMHWRYEQLTLHLAAVQHHSHGAPQGTEHGHQDLGVGARAVLHGEDPGPPSPPALPSPPSPAGALQPVRGRARRRAARVGHGPCAAGEGRAAHRGAHGRTVPLRADPRCSSASGWEPAGGSVPAHRFARPEQAIQVPKISSSHHRSRRRRVPLVQTTEQLVEVPEFVQLTLQFRRLVAEFFKVFSLGRIIAWLRRRTLTFQFLMVVTVGAGEEVFKVHAQDRNSAAFCGWLWRRGRSSRFTPRSEFSCFILALAWCCG